MKRTILVLLAAILGITLTQWDVSSVKAQEADMEEFTLEEITVTAEKREVNLQAVPRSISVITADDLDLRSASSVIDILSTTAGINIQGWRVQLFIRGVGPAGTIMGQPGAEPSVQFNVDGNLGMMSGGANAVLTSMNDVERIEVMRGPAGAINGRMAAAGTINVITKDPDFEKLDGNVSITAGDYDTMNTSAATNIPLKLTGLDLPAFIENLSFRVAVREDKHSEYIHNSDGEGVSGSQNFFTSRIKMKWQPIESLNILAQYNYSRDKSDDNMDVKAIDQVQTFPRTYEPHPEDPWLNADGSAASDQVAVEQYSKSVEASWANRFGTLTGRYGKSWVPWKCDGGVEVTGAMQRAVCYEDDIFQDEYELRMNSPDESRIKWMAGVYRYYKKEYAGPDEQFEEMDPANTTITFSNFYGNANFFTDDITSPDFDANDPTRSWAVPAIDPVLPDSVVFVPNSGTRPIESYSYFGNITVPFFEDKHRFSLGLRKTVEDKTRLTVVGVFAFDDTYLDSSGNPIPHFTFDPSEADPTTGQWVCDNCYMIASEPPHLLATEDNPLSYTVGWEYDWKPEVLLYANVNNGFKPGGVSAEARPVVLYEPEYLINYAVGMRSRWFQNRLQLNVEAYLMDYDNLQTSISTQSSITYELGGTAYTQAFSFQSRVINIGKTYINGVDIDYNWLITSRDRLQGTIAYKDAKYGSFVYRLGLSGMPPGHPEYADFDGRPMPLAPKFTFNANYSHLFTLGNMMVTPRFDVKYSTEYITFNQWWWDVAGAEILQPAYWKYDAYLNIGPEDGRWQLNAYIKNIDETVVRTVSFMQTQIEAPRTMGVGLTVRF